MPDMKQNAQMPHSVEEVLEMNDTELFDTLRQINLQQPQNRMASSMLQNQEAYLGLQSNLKEELKSIIAPGMMSVDSKIGVYMRSPEDYRTFGAFINPIINDYHGVEIERAVYRSNWEIGEETFDLNNLHESLKNVSMRVRIAGIPKDVNLPAKQTLEERIAFENKMVNIFDKMIEKNGGRYVSLTNGSKYQISNEEFQGFVDDHLMFKDMTEDPHLKVSDLAAHWPNGRGMFIREVNGSKFIVWVGEEDPLRIMCLKTGSRLEDVFLGLRNLVEELKSNGLELIEDPIIGATTSCPSNIGTAMRMSIHMDMEQVLKGNTMTKEELQAQAKEFGIQVRGADGETTSRESKVFDLSPSARYGKTQVEILKGFYDGLGELVKEINKNKEN